MNPRQKNPALAVIFMVSATVFIAGTMLAAKLLGKDTLGPPLHPLQISHGRFVFAFLAIALTSIVLRPTIMRPNIKLHISRTLFGWFGVTLMFASVTYIPISDATAISFLNPVIGMLLAIPLLGERVGPWRWFAAAMAFSGALLLLRPGFETFQIAALLALGAAFAMGFEVIFIKKLADRESPLQILLINNTIGLLIASIAVYPVIIMPTSSQLMVLIALGLGMAAAQACFVNAMARADASFITPFSYLTLLFVVIYDALVFNNLPDWISLVGASIIFLGGTILAWREGLLHRRAKSKIVVSPGARQNQIKKRVGII